jgi:hypothetical protein
MFKVTEKKVREEIDKCWNRAKRHRYYFSLPLIFESKQHIDNINNIKIIIKNSKKTYATIQKRKYGNKENPFYLETLLTINETFKNKSEFESTVAHEMAHFIDFSSYRNSNHDLIFFHNFYIMSNKKNKTFKNHLIDHMCTYFMNEKETLKAYTRIINET